MSDLIKEISKADSKSAKENNTIIAFVNYDSKLELVGAFQETYDIFPTDSIDILKYGITIDVELGRDNTSLWSHSTNTKHTSKKLVKTETIQDNWIEDYNYTDVLYIKL